MGAARGSFPDWGGGDSRGPPGLWQGRSVADYYGNQAPAAGRVAREPGAPVVVAREPGARGERLLLAGLWGPVWRR